MGLSHKRAIEAMQRYRVVTIDVRVAQSQANSDLKDLSLEELEALIEGLLDSLDDDSADPLVGELERASRSDRQIEEVRRLLARVRRQVGEPSTADLGLDLSNLAKRLSGIKNTVSKLSGRGSSAEVVEHAARGGKVLEFRRPERGDKELPDSKRLSDAQVVELAKDLDLKPRDLLRAVVSTRSMAGAVATLKKLLQELSKKE